MHHVGMFVDQNARAEAERNALARTVALRKELADLAGDPDFNPGSTQQLRRLLFRDWSLTPNLDDKIRFTASGDASTSDDVLRALFTQRMKKPQRLFVKKLRQYRKVMKELGTYIVKLRPMADVVSGLGWDDDARRLEWEAERDPELLAMMAAEREKRGYESRGIVWVDGRMRPGYNAHVTVSGRLSSSSPINAQNFPKHLRKLIVPQPGNVLVGADYDQLELRIAAARWGLRKYLDAFDAGWDPHTSVTAYSVFGEDFVKAAGTPFPWMTGTKFQGDANDMRQLAKIIQYAFQYKASVETGARIIQSTELTDEETGDPILPYARLSVKQVRQMRQSWLAGIPQLAQGWDAEIAHYRSYGWVAEPVHGRRRYFLDGENPNEIVNTPIQGAASALVNDAMIAIHKDIPLHKWGPGTGLLTQTHDALVVECPEHAAPWVVECINHHMNKRHPDLPGVLFSANAEIGMTWKEVG
jgi:DNA polymerase-1